MLSILGGLDKVLEKCFFVLERRCVFGLWIYDLSSAVLV